MGLPQYEMPGRTVTLLSGYPEQFRKEPKKRKLYASEIRAIDMLHVSASSNPDAVAFGYVAGKWVAAA